MKKILFLLAMIFTLVSCSSTTNKKDLVQKYSLDKESAHNWETVMPNVMMAEATNPDWYGEDNPLISLRKQGKMSEREYYFLDYLGKTPANQITDEKMYIGRTALQIVLSNLISNAVKYSDSPGKVTIGVTEEWIYVNNTCKDAEQLDIDRLFEVNFDLSKDNSNGLGLYIVRNILLSYGIEHKVVRRKSSVTFMIKLSVPE